MTSIIAVIPILADVVEVKKGSRSTAHWSNDFIRLNRWLRNSFAQLITLLTSTASAKIGKTAIYWHVRYAVRKIRLSTLSLRVHTDSSRYYIVIYPSPFSRYGVQSRNELHLHDGHRDDTIDHMRVHHRAYFRGYPHCNPRAGQRNDLLDGSWSGSHSLSSILGVSHLEGLPRNEQENNIRNDPRSTSAHIVRDDRAR